MRMKVDGLTPNELWQTAVEDIGLATAVQAAYHEGRDEVRREKRKKQEAAKRKADDRKHEQELRKQYGL